MAASEPKGSFARWQSVTITQLTHAVNLVLSLAVATLGFQVSLLLGEDFKPESWQKCAFGLSLLLLSASIVFAVAVVVNRLRDFRATKEAERLREQGAPESTIELYRVLYRRLGAVTWGLFWCQLGTFGLGVLLTIVAVLASAGHKLL